MTNDLTAALFFFNGLFALYLCGSPRWAAGTSTDSLRVRVSLAVFSVVFLASGWWMLFTRVVP